MNSLDTELLKELSIQNQTIVQQQREIAELLVELLKILSPPEQKKEEPSLKELMLLQIEMIEQLINLVGKKPSPLQSEGQKINTKE